MVEAKNIDIPKEYLIQLNNKEFITHRGLLWLAHEKGVKSIITKWVNEMIDNPVFKAVVTMKDDSVFTGYGDASKENVNNLIARHMIRMAETRAINRALRLATNCGITSAEELGGENNG